MLIKYVGGRSWIRVILERKSYIFDLENKRTLDINDQRVINYIFSLPNNSEFQVVMEEKKINQEVKEEIKKDQQSGYSARKPGRPKKEKNYGSKKS